MTRGRIATALLGLLTAVIVGAPAAAQDLKKVKIIIPQNSVFVLNYMGGKDAGIFEKHGIDLEVDARPFGGFLAGLPSKECMVGTYSGLTGILKMNQGLDWVVIGGGLTVFQRVFVRKDSPIQKVEDLRGKRFGLWSTGAGSVKSVRAAMIEAFGLDIVKDTQIVEVAPPAVFKMAQRGDVDAMFNISSFTIRAASMPDQFRDIFSVNEYWKEKTGYPVIWSAPLFAWREWVEEDRERAKNVSEAIAESYRWLRKPENLDAAVEKYGTLAGVSTPEVVATYKEWLGAERLFLTEWTQEAVDAQWQFLELAKRHGIIEKVPPKDKHALVLGN